MIHTHLHPLAPHYAVSDPNPDARDGSVHQTLQELTKPKVAKLLDTSIVCSQYATIRATVRRDSDNAAAAGPRGGLAVGQRPDFHGSALANIGGFPYTRATRGRGFPVAVSIHKARLGAKARVMLPKAVREALGLRPGDTVAFVIDGADVRVARTPFEAEDLFACFSEWASEADRKGYADL